MSMIQVAIVFGSIVIAWQPALAVIISSGDGSANTTAPSNQPAHSDFEFWDNVGRQGSGAAVYLGNNWVLTAAHVNGGEPAGVTLQGQFFQRDATIAPIRLQNTDDGSGINPTTDLRMFRITQAPSDVPAVTISTAIPDVGDEVLMIGTGRDREIDLAFWDADGQRSATPSDFSGFQWKASQTKRWGTNRVAERDLIVEVTAGATDFGDIFAFATTFNEVGAAVFEAQAAGGDSGGGVFVRRNGQWELAGLIHAITGPEFNGQPIDASIFGEASIFGSQTLISDLSFYRDQIVAVVPEPATLGVLIVAMMVVSPGRYGRRGALSVPA